MGSQSSNFSKGPPPRWFIPKGETGTLIAQFPWATTPFGPMESWPAHLRMAVNMMMECKAPATLIWGPDFHFIYNDAYVEILQDKHPRAMGQPAIAIYPEVWSTILPLFTQAYGGEGVVIDNLAVNLNRNGKTMEAFFYGSYNPVRDEAGNSCGFFAVVVETTQQILLERERAQVFDNVLSSIPDFAYTLSPEGRFLYINNALLSLWGLPLAEAVGKNFFELGYPPDLATRLQTQIEAVVATKAPVRDQTPYLSPSGVIGYYDYIFTPVLGPDGTVSLISGITRDISDSQKHAGELEELVKERTARLQETIAELESYSYSISHDLRGPLRAMQSFAEALREDCAAQIGPIGQDYIRRIVAAAERMDRIIQDVLVHSRLSRSEMPLEILRLEEFIPSLIEAYPAFQQTQAEIRVERPMPSVVANHAALTQCVANLIGNATKFVASGVQPKVSISSRVAGDRVYVSIADNGIGIAEKDREIIFDAFRRLNPAYEGTGIGLAIVRRAVERMGGRVTVASAPEGGSVFTLDLQLAV